MEETHFNLDGFEKRATDEEGIEFSNDAIRLGKPLVDKLLGDDGSIILSLELFAYRNGGCYRMSLSDYILKTLLENEKIRTYMGVEEEFGMFGFNKEFEWKFLDGEVDTIQPRLGLGLNVDAFVPWFKERLKKLEEQIDNDVNGCGFSNN